MSEEVFSNGTASQFPGLPPLPRCFSGLLGSDSSQWRETERMHAMKSNLLDELANESLTDMSNGSSDGHPIVNGVDQDGDSRPHPVSSFFRLNSSLTQLRREMVDLRQLDMSLLCQLWSLHESIQDYKVIMTQDRFSETNSECSFGTGMSSRADSFSSLNDDSDWGEQDYLEHQHHLQHPQHLDNSMHLQQHLLQQQQQQEVDLQVAQSIHSSTSSLLQQITQLKERVDAEF